MADTEQLLNKGTSTFRPRARIIRAIGQDLISNHVIALVELIKNAYDADASEVTIRFVPPLTEDHGAIIVRDNGIGMTESDLQQSWMEPAASEKRKQPVSPGGRRRTGEKGIGRFASARLAQEMILQSVSGETHQRITAYFSWANFDEEAKYLDEIPCTWEVHGVEADTHAGTELELGTLRDNWDARAFSKLRAELSRLIVRPTALQDKFSIRLELPDEYQDYAGEVTQPAVLEHPHYSVSGELDDEGTLNIAITIGNEKYSISEPAKITDWSSDKTDQDDEALHSPACGSFTFNLKVWERDTERLAPLVDRLGSSIRDIRRDLDQAYGISIYRDAFRVMPYGDRGDDWLRLDHRRVLSSFRLSNNQIVGAIHITADGNPALRDQTNREGIVASKEFDDLKSVIVLALSKLEAKRRSASKEKPPRLDPKGLFRELDIKPIRQAFKERYPKDVEFLALLSERADQIDASTREVQNVISRYSRLATLGQLLDKILHEGRTGITAIGHQCELGLTDGSRQRYSTDLRETLEQRLKSIQGRATTLSSLFDLLEPLSGRKRSRIGEIYVEQEARSAAAFFEKEFKSNGIELELPKTSTMVSGYSGQLQVAFVNLLKNSIYWLGYAKTKEPKIRIDVVEEEGKVVIVFSDNGPGVSTDDEKYIFDPYYSTKPNGIGLGLTIAGEAVKEHDGNLDLIESTGLPGATFRITLPK